VGGGRRAGTSRPTGFTGMGEMLLEGWGLSLERDASSESEEGEGFVVEVAGGVDEELGEGGEADLGSDGPAIEDFADPLVSKALAVMGLAPAGGEAEAIVFAVEGFFEDGAGGEDLAGIDDLAGGAGVAEVGDPMVGEFLLGDDGESVSGGAVGLFAVFGVP
jgi:hypothetical protein